MRAKALYACQAENAGEVSFASNAVLVNVRYSSEDGWLEGTVQGTDRRGLFPAVYTELAPETGDDVALLRRLQADGLLSSAAQLEAFRGDLDSSTSGAVSRSFKSTVQRSETYYSSSTAGGSQAPVHASYAASSMTASAQSTARGLPAAQPAAPPAPPVRWVLLPPAPDNGEQEAARRREADAASAWEKTHLAAKLSAVPPRPAPKPAIAAAPKPQPAAKSPAELAEEVARHERERSEAASWEAKHLARAKAQGAPRAIPRPALAPRPVAPKPTATKPVVSHPVVPPKSAAELAEESERHARERAEAASWEAKHLAKTKQLADSRDTARLLGAANAAKPAVSIATKPAVSIATKPAAPVCPRKEPAPAAPPMPAKTAKSATCSSVTRTTTSSSSSSNCASARAVQQCNPATENDAPALPYNASRAAVMSELLVKARPAPPSNPATANDAPSLPFDRHRAAAVGGQVAKRVDGALLPSSQGLIRQINQSGGASGMAAARAMMAPGTTTASHTSSSMTKAMTMTESSSSFQSSSSFSSSEHTSTAGVVAAPFPLTATHEVRGVRPFPSQTFTSNSSQSFSHKESHSMTSSNCSSNGGFGASAGIPHDALQRYKALFAQLDQETGRRGILGTDTVRDAVAKSRLPDATLRNIWQLADRNMNGTFGPGEFNIIMHLVDCALRNDPAPTYLPIDLLHSAYA